MTDAPQPFFEHLEELRSRLISAMIAVAIGAAVAFQFTSRIIDFLARPVGRFIFIQPTEAFFVRLKIALVAGVMIALPVVLFQIWKFVVVALTPAERKSLMWLLPASYALFVGGFAFGFFVLVPAGIGFLLGYGTPTLVPSLSVAAYIDFVGAICLALGAVFQMPVVAFYLSRIGILQPSFLSRQRRIAVLIIYAASALLTPGPDPVTALLLALPTYVLFECSIWTARLAVKNETFLR